MARYELTISPEYIPSWGIWEAFRELYQNVLDRKGEGTESIIQYNMLDQTLVIGNKNTNLGKETLLLGHSTKANSSESIGKYGEGYKLALLILARKGYRVTIKNAQEVWSPKIIKSRRYNSELLIVDTSSGDKNNSDLLFEIKGITIEDFQLISSNCLDLMTIADEDKKEIEGEGTILLSDKLRKKVFVNGLYVCSINNDRMLYGYSFSPHNIELDRDRRNVTEFNLFWETSKLFALGTKQNSEDEFFSMKTVHALIFSSPDLEYFKSHSQRASSDFYADLCELTYKEFLEEHGEYSVPVSDEAEADDIRKRYKGLVPVKVPSKTTEYITSAPSYSSRMSSVERVYIPTPKAEILSFKDKYLGELSGEAQEAFDTLVSKAECWKIADKKSF